MGAAGQYPRLENIVDRSLILTPGLVLQVPLSEPHAELELDSEETERRFAIRNENAFCAPFGSVTASSTVQTVPRARLGFRRTALQSGWMVSESVREGIAHDLE